jgi:hypothetical protein
VETPEEYKGFSSQKNQEVWRQSTKEHRETGHRYNRFRVPLYSIRLIQLLIHGKILGFTAKTEG